MRTKVVLLSILALATISLSGGFDTWITTTEATQKTAGIPLKRGARVNGYTTTQKGPGSFEFGAVNVQDPVTKLPVTGNGKLQYKCGQIPYIGRLFFNKGNSDRIKVNCLILITPRIIIED